MKKIICQLFISFILLSSCSEDQLLLYNEKPSLYFKLSNTNTSMDSLSFSFLVTMENSYVVKIPVNLMGMAYNQDREFIVKILPSSTAVEGKHYQAFSEKQIFPAGSYFVDLPITVLNIDPELENGPVYLNLSIEDNNDFDLGDYKRTKMKLLISNLIIKPAAWEHSYAITCFGPYSKVKYRLYVSMFGEFPTIENITSNYNYYRLVQAGQLKLYLQENYPVYDENNQIISYTW